MGTLYKLDFANGKSYIGISLNPSKLFADHKRCALDGKGNSNNKGKRLSAEKRVEMSMLRKEEWARRRQNVGKL